MFICIEQDETDTIEPCRLFIRLDSDGDFVIGTHDEDDDVIDFAGDENDFCISTDVALKLADAIRTLANY